MTVEELAGKRYGGEFVFMFGHLEGRTRFVFECFDPKDPSESFFDVYDKDEMKMIYTINISILKEMFVI